uniref:Alanine dehydrogenase/pyridine nucleotide transhydrogenase NAD(H)-binding domain-containing protein n=1 Tax=Branchiostoma floridae TaxID=7739 RepID=C3ZFX2_BRAFL|eukprot:XP_002592599.1 hypothetical protein BRAFLDRAFT_68922 [Branchiostoma floridae]
MDVFRKRPVPEFLQQNKAHRGDNSTWCTCGTHSWYYSCAMWAVHLEQLAKTTTSLTRHHRTWLQHGGTTLRMLCGGSRQNSSDRSVMAIRREDGAQEIFNELPHEYVHPKDLKEVCETGDTSRCYATVLSRKHHLKNKDTGVFSAEEYDSHPERYISTFAQEYAPYVSCLVNGIYWPPNAPRLLTFSDLQNLLSPDMAPKHVPEGPGMPRLPHRLVAVCDISADPGGSLEFMTECTSIDVPFILYDAEHHVLRPRTSSFAGDGVLVCSIDNFPAQLPREATDYFGNLLIPYVWQMLKSRADVPFEEQEGLFSPTVSGAIITSNGRLTPRFEYIAELRAQKQKQKEQAKA